MISFYKCLVFQITQKKLYKIIYKNMKLIVSVYILSVCLLIIIILLSPHKKRDYFFDNCSENLKGLEKFLIIVKVDDSDNITTTDPIAFQHYTQTLNRNAQEYARHSYQTHRFDCFDPKSQISLSQIRQVVEDIQKDIVRTLIFDWDRTLTKFVDVVDERDSMKSKNISMRDVAEFYFGDRFNALSVLWKEAKEKNVTIYIISTNPRVQSDPYLFINLLRETCLDLPIKNLIYVRDSREKQNMVKSLL